MPQTEQSRAKETAGSSGSVEVFRKQNNSSLITNLPAGDNEKLQKHLAKIHTCADLPILMQGSRASDLPPALVMIRLIYTVCSYEGT